MPRPRAIVSLQETTDLSHIRMCLYGDPGSGKTPLIGTGARTLILDADNGLESAKIAGSKADRWRMKDHGDLMEAYEFLRHGGTDDYSWVWLDSITLFQERGLTAIMQDLIDSGKTHRHLYLPDKGEYGQNMQRIKIWFRDMVDLPMHFGFTAHVLRTEDRDGAVVYMPSVQGKGMPDSLGGYMNIIGRLIVEERKGEQVRVLQVQKHETYYGKDRFGAVPQGRLLNPTIPKLEALVAGKLQGAAVPKKTNGAKKVSGVKKVAKKATAVKKTASTIRRTA